MKRPVARFNERLAVLVTEALGTMWCTYAFLLLCLLPLFLPAYQGAILYVSNCFQLVFLPLLMVSGLVQGRKAERRAIADHRALRDSHRILLGEVQELKAVYDELMALECRKAKAIAKPKGQPK